MKTKPSIALFSILSALLFGCGVKNSDGTSFSELQTFVDNETYSSADSNSTVDINSQVSDNTDSILPTDDTNNTPEDTIQTAFTDNSPAEDTPSLSNPQQNTALDKQSASPQMPSVSPNTPAPQYPLTDTVDTTYCSIYAQKVTEITADSNKYALIYLDSDAIPELVVYNADYDAYSIYTIKDNAAFCMVDTFRTVELTYFEQKGIISSFARWNGGGDEGGYGDSYYQTSTDKTLTNESIPLLQDTYNAVYDDTGIFTGNGITEYYHMGQEIDEASYQTMLGDLGIVQGGSNCIENALAKEEFLRTLTQ